MATNQENVQNIINLEEEILQDNKFSKDFYQTKIVLLETDKEKFQEPAEILDQALFKQVKALDTLRDELSDLYTAQVNDGNISDSFYRVIGYGSFFNGVGTDIYYQLKKETLKRFYDIEPNVYDNGGAITPVVGFNTESVMIYDGDGSFTTVNLNKVDGKLSVEGNSTFANFIEIENKDGIKLYTEPYTADLLDTLVARSYGVIESGSNKLTLLTPLNNSSNSLNNIAEDQVVTPDPEGAFTGVEFATVLGVGTTDVDLSIYPESIVGVATTALQTVPYITLDAVGAAGFGTDSVPNDDGVATLFEFSIDPSQVNLDDFSVEFDASAYVPQRIRVVKKKSELDGNGVKIERVVNEPISTTVLKDAEWNRFLDGFPNPSDIDVTISEPEVTNGKQIYNLGFTISGTPRIPNQGNSVQVINNSPSFNTLYSTGSGISGGDQTTINNKRTDKDAAATSWTNSDKTQARFDLSNAFKDQMNEINTEIWGMRAQLGKADEIITSKKQFKQLVLDSDILNLLDNPDDI